MISTDKTFTKLITPKQFIKKESDFYNSMSDEEYLILVKKYISETDLVNIIIADEFNVELASLYGTIIESKELTTKDFIEYLNTRLGRMNKELWLKEFDKKHYNCFDLLVTLGNHNCKPNLKSEFQDVLINFISKIQKKELDPDNLKESWPKYLNSLDDDNRTSFMDKIRHIIIHENTDFSDIVILFENILIDCDLFKDFSGELINIGFNSLLRRESEIELNWMLSIISSCQEEIDWHSSSFMISLKDRIKNRLVNMDEKEEKKENVNRILAQIANVLEVDLNTD